MLPKGGIARFYGTAKVHKSGPIYDEVWQSWSSPKRIAIRSKKGCAVTIKVDRAEDLDGAPLDIK